MPHRSYAIMLFSAFFIAVLSEHAAGQNSVLSTDTTAVPSTSTIQLNNGSSSTTVSVVNTTPRIADENWSVKDTSSATCILVDAEPDAKFAIYHSSGGRTVHLQLEKQLSMNSDEVSVSGNCSTQNNNMEMTLSWSSYRFTFVFTQVIVCVIIRRHWDLAILWCVLRDFVNLTTLADSATVSSLEDPAGYLTTPANMSHSCNDPPRVAMIGKSSNATVLFSSLKLQAYVGTDGSFGPEFTCGNPLGDAEEVVAVAPTPRSDTVPIAVGTTMAVLTLLVIVGYAIYRSFTFKKVDYDTME